MSYPIKILFAIVLVALVYQFINSGELQTVLADITVSATKQVAGSILNLINAPAFVSTASLLIVASGFLACAWYWIEGVQPRRRVVQATKAELADLLALTREGVKKEADVWPTLERIVPRDGFFATSWGLFAASRQRGHGGERLIPFSWYIAQDSAVDGRRRCNLMSSLPGYFTTVGLILTFIGLVAALYFAGRGFRSGDMAEARNAIVQLLAASSFKFLTSVAALMSAFIVSLFARFADSRLRDDIAQAAELVDQLAVYSPATTNAMDRLVAAIEALSQQISGSPVARSPAIAGLEALPQAH